MRFFCVVLVCDLLECILLRIDGSYLFCFGVYGQLFICFWVEIWVIWLIYWLKRKGQDGCIFDESFKIYVVVLNFEVSFFFIRICEKFLEFDFDGLSDVDQVFFVYFGVFIVGGFGYENVFVD